MTVFGPDISSFQHGLDLSRLTAASFVIAKATEGTYYTDASYPGWRQQAKTLGKTFVWYHFLSGESPAAQAVHTQANVGDTTLPGMLDFEPEGTYRPSLAQAVAYVYAARNAGLNLRLIYLPRWYWQEIGSPDLSFLSGLGLDLVSSAYPGGSGTPGQLYPGDSASGWQSYGGLAPALYQYTDRAADGGQSLDYNAFRGTASDLTRLLGATTVPNIPPSIGQKWPDIAAQFPANQPFDNDIALIWADGGARAAALFAQQARDAINALGARLATPPSVDVAALAATLAPLLHPGGASADEVAAAVVAHLAQRLGGAP